MKTRPTLLAAAALTLAAGCGSEAAPEPATPPQAAASARVGSAGATVELLSGWHTTTWGDGNVVDPLTRIVVASAPIQPKDTACQVAQYDFAADAVALIVLEWREFMSTLPERPAHFTSRELPVQAPPAIECFDGSGGSAQFIDQGRTFGAYLLVGPQAPAQLVDEARSVLDTLEVERRGDELPKHLARNGISIAVPEGWDGRILFREATGRHGVIFQVANFVLPANEGLERPNELPPGEEDPIKAMDDGEVLVMVIDGAEAGATASTPLELSDLEAVHGPRVPHGHSLAQGSFCFASRCVGVEVDFGAAQPRDDLVRRVNEVLASIAVVD